MTEPLAALLWDVDGTLLDNEELHRAAFNAAFADHDLDWRWDEALYADLLSVTGGRERIAHFAALHDPERAAGPGFDDFVARLHRHKSRLYAERLADPSTQLRPGVARLIGEVAAAGLPQALVTATTAPNVDALLQRFFPGESPFAVVASGDRVARKKPAPDLYRLALAELRLPATACMAVEDSAHGLTAARAAGVATLVVPSRYSRGESFDGARAVVNHLGEPGAPCHPLAGPCNGPMVDLAQLRRWHGARAPRSAER